MHDARPQTQARLDPASGRRSHVEQETMHQEHRGDPPLCLFSCLLGPCKGHAHRAALPKVLEMGCGTCGGARWSTEYGARGAKIGLSPRQANTGIAVPATSLLDVHEAGARFLRSVSGLTIIIHEVDANGILLCMVHP